jgi:hypothetical protein
MRRLGWGLGLAGLALASIGTALYLAQDERPAYGLVVTAAGGGLAAGGITILTF